MGVFCGFDADVESGLRLVVVIERSTGVAPVTSC